MARRNRGPGLPSCPAGCRAGCRRGAPRRRRPGRGRSSRRSGARAPRSAPDRRPRPKSPLGLWGGLGTSQRWARLAAGGKTRPRPPRQNTKVRRIHVAGQRPRTPSAEQRQGARDAAGRFQRAAEVDGPRANRRSTAASGCRRPEARLDLLAQPGGVDHHRREPAGRQRLQRATASAACRAPRAGAWACASVSGRMRSPRPAARTIARCSVMRCSRHGARPDGSRARSTRPGSNSAAAARPSAPRAWAEWSAPKLQT